MLEAGVKAPEFSLQDKDGNIVANKENQLNLIF